MSQYERAYEHFEATTTVSSLRSYVPQLKHLMAEVTGQDVDDLSRADFDVLLRGGYERALAASESRGQLSPSTWELRYYAVRKLMQSAYELGVISADEWTQVQSLSRHAWKRGDVEKRGAEDYFAPGTEAVQILFESLRQDPTPDGRRDEALFALAINGGLRASEIVALSMDHVDPRAGTLVIPAGRSAGRVVYLSGTARACLQGWLDVRGTTAGILIPAHAGQWYELTRPMTTQTLRSLLRQRYINAGLQPRVVDDFRRAYLAFQEEALRRAERTRQVPYVGTDV